MAKHKKVIKEAREIAVFMGHRLGGFKIANLSRTVSWGTIPCKLVVAFCQECGAMACINLDLDGLIMGRAIYYRCPKKIIDIDRITW